MLSVIEKYKLYVIPLCSIDEHNRCTCGQVACSSPGKHPYFKFNWKLIASNETEKIKGWTNKYGHLNWAVLTGRKSPVTGLYLSVVDIDTKTHDIKQSLPKTFSYSTGNGSHHWYWSDKPVKSSVSLLAQSVDVRGSNSYVVIPPSKHASGAKYRFISVDDYNIAPLPKLDTVERVSSGDTVRIPNTHVRKKSTYTKTPMPELRRTLAKNGKISTGSRNTTIHRLLSSDRANGAQKPYLIRQSKIYRAACIDPHEVTDLELKRIIASVMKYPCYNNMFEAPKGHVDIDGFFKEHVRKTDLFDCTLEQIKQGLYRHGEQDDGVIDQIPDQWLAAQLKAKGFAKKRTSSGNKWLLRLI